MDQTPGGRKPEIEAEIDLRAARAGLAAAREDLATATEGARAAGLSGEEITRILDVAEDGELARPSGCGA